MKASRNARLADDALLPLGLSFSGAPRSGAIHSPWSSLSNGLVRATAEPARLSPAPADGFAVQGFETALPDEEAPELSAGAGTPLGAVRDALDRAEHGPEVPEVSHDHGGAIGPAPNSAASWPREPNPRARRPTGADRKPEVGTTREPSAVPPSLEGGTRRSGSERPGTAPPVAPPHQGPAHSARAPTARAGKPTVPVTDIEHPLDDSGRPRTEPESSHVSTRIATSGAHGSARRTRALTDGEAPASLASDAPRPAHHVERAATPSEPNLERAPERSGTLPTLARATRHGSARDVALTWRPAPDHAPPLPHAESAPAPEPRSTMGGAADSASPAPPLPLLPREKATTRRSVRIGTLRINVAAAKARTLPRPSPAAAPQRAPAPAGRLAPPAPTWADPWHGEWFRFD
jgi:hypothetical protein